MKVALLGGTGFVGRYLIDEIRAAGHDLVVLSRSHSDDRYPGILPGETVIGDVRDDDAVRHTLVGADVVLYNIGILREYPKRGITFEALHYEGARRTIDIAVESGISRFLLMSANGVRAGGTPYQKTKHRAEEYLRASPLRWTIFRPSVLFGDPRGRMEFATQLYRDIVSAPLPLPLFYDGLWPVGAGRAQMSPVHVRDVAKIFALSLSREDSVGRVYPIGGPEAMSWEKILRVIAQATGKRRFGVPVPAWAMKTVADLLAGTDILPVTRDQLTMLMEGNTCESSAIFREFGIDPVRFDAENLDYLTAVPAHKA